MFRRKEKLPGPINYLPEEMLRHLVSFASTKSQIQLRQTSTFFYDRMTTREFMRAHSDYVDKIREYLSLISRSAMNGLNAYLSVNDNRFIKSKGLRRAIFYEAVMKHSAVTPLMMAVSVYAILKLEGGRELKKIIVNKISVDSINSISQALDYPRVLNWGVIVKRFVMLCHQYTSDEFDLLANKLFELQLQPGIKDKIIARYGGELCDMYRYVNDREQLSVNLLLPLQQMEKDIIEVCQYKR